MNIPKTNKNKDNLKMEIYYSKALLKFVKNNWKKKVNFY